MTSEWPSLHGARCLVTGGSSGIGMAVVKLLYDNNARIIACGRDRTKLDDLARELPDRARLETVLADVADKTGRDTLFEAARTRLGGLDILVSNAAIAGESVLTMQEDEVEDVIRINLFGQIACVRRALSQMQAGGRILMVGSMSADVREEEGNSYVASKAGLQGFAGALRKQASKQSIHVHLIEPGAVATPLHGLTREELAQKQARFEMLDPTHIAECVAFVLTRSEACDIVSLQVRPHRQHI